MQSAAVPGTSNGIKRTAASALLNQSGTNNGSNSNDGNESNTSSSNSQSISPPPPEKRSFIVVDTPIKLDTIDSAEDLDLKVLKIQNKNLSERLLQRQRLENELKDKIDKLQERKLADENKICVLDRYWTQLDEDLRAMLERFDNTEYLKCLDEISNKSNSGKAKEPKSAIRNFIAKLNDWDKIEVEENLKDRVKFTTQTVSKLIANYDKLTKRAEQYWKELKQQKQTNEADKMDTSASNSGVNKSLTTSNVADNRIQELLDENVRLNELITKYQKKSHESGLERKQLEDKITKYEIKIAKNEETEYELEKFRDKAYKLDRHLAEAQNKLVNLQKLNNTLKNNPGTTSSSEQNGHHNHQNTRNDNKSSNQNEKQLTDIESELEEQKELAASRLSELEKLNQNYQNSLKQIEKLKADLKLMPESLIEQSSEYKQLQIKYSLVVNDNIKLKQSLDESKNLIEMSRVTFQRQIEQMESEELNQQKRLGTEMMQLEEQLTQIRKENELLRIEYEQNVAANEQTGPINKEMRSLITTLQTNNKLLKSDNVRTKKRLEELTQEIEKLKKQTTQSPQSADSPALTAKLEPRIPLPKTEPDTLLTAESIKSEEETSKESLKDVQLKELKEENKRLAETQKDLKNLLEIYTKSNKQQQSPGSSSGSNTKHKIVELEEAKLEIKRLKESLDKYKSSANKIIIPSSHMSSATTVTSPHHHHHHHHHMPLNDDHHSPLSQGNSTAASNSMANDYAKKIKSLEETIRELHKSLSAKKQEETALLNDMEITGQAFEDVEEQNIRLMQQLREKDDANFKLVSERIKLENVQKIIKEEKEIYAQRVNTLQEQLEAQMSISKKLEDQQLLASQTIMITEKEIVHLQHSCENYRRQAIDNIQIIQDLKMNTQKYLNQLKEIQNQVGEKSESLASQMFANKRLQEEIKQLQAKLDRQKKFENVSSMDEVLREEIKEYKEQLRCPSCKVKQKDAVLTKCFHVFCYDCLQKRYDTRQRKCPECNANFGANDFHKLYLS